MVLCILIPVISKNILHIFFERIIKSRLYENTGEKKIKGACKNPIATAAIFVSAQKPSNQKTMNEEADDRLNKLEKA